MDDHIFIDEYPVIDKAKDARRDFLADAGPYVDITDHSVDFLNPGSIFFADDPAFKKFCEELSGRFRNFAEELQKTGYLAGNRVAKAIDDAFGIERPNTMYGDKQGFLLIDENTVFDYTFVGSDGSIEKMEPAKPVYDISWIRKRMKCCKNPMERKQLEKQLNAVYKARKKARKKK